MNSLNMNLSKPNDTEYGINPKRFNLWLIIVAIIMLFAGLTSAYIVRRAEGNWMQFSLPVSMWLNSALILLSSVSMIWAYRAAKKDELSQIRIALFITLALGIAFLIGQYYTFLELSAQGIYFSASGSGVSGTFLIAIAFLHAMHIIGGLLYLCIMLYQAFRLNVHKKNLLHISLCNTYWHFIGILWVYLFVFFYLYR